MSADAHNGHGLRCAHCGMPLADDQRYCVECGTRRGGLPQVIAERINAILARGELAALGPGAGLAGAGAAGEAAAAAGAAGEPGAATGAAGEAGAGAAAGAAGAGAADGDADGAPDPAGGVPALAGAAAAGPLGRSMPSPRASAVAIMAMLAFGVVVGSLASAATSAPPRRVVIALAPSAPVTPGTTAPVTPAPTVTGPAAAAPATAVAPATTTSSSPSSSSSSPSSSSPSSSSNANSLPPVKHVFLIMLADERYDESFGTPANDPYLATTLRNRGELLPNYYAVTSGDLANEIALVSGQGPTNQTAANCPKFINLAPGTPGTQEQALGGGCVYPSATLSLADQLTAAGKTWKAYVEGMNNGPKGQAKSCRHPALGSADAGQSASLHDPYTTWSNPFVYFHSIGKAGCAKDDVSLGALGKDLKSSATTPTLSYIAPSPCDDGYQTPCVTGAEDGLKAADRFLKGVVPEILASPAYKDGGMIAITFDQAPQSGPYMDTSACCDNPGTYPNLIATGGTPTTTTPTTTTPTTTTPTTTTPATTTPTTMVPYAIAPTTTPTTPTTPTPTTTPTTTTPIPTPLSEQTGQTTPTGGGGEVGLLLISQYVKANTTDESDYFSHYSLLASIEKLFSLKRLGYAGLTALPAFGSTVYTKYKPS